MADNQELYKPALYALLNVVSASGIVFANKAVMTTFGFQFIYALTLIHTLCTLIGMQIFCQMVSSILFTDFASIVKAVQQSYALGGIKGDEDLILKYSSSNTSWLGLWSVKHRVLILVEL